ncbi:MAG: hypothetical protein ACRECY_09820 [Phyllobacterium sp.]
MAAMKKCGIGAFAAAVPVIRSLETAMAQSEKPRVRWSPLPVLSQERHRRRLPRVGDPDGSIEPACGEFKQRISPKALIFRLFVCYHGTMSMVIRVPHSFSSRRYIDRACRDTPHLFNKSIAFCRDNDAKWRKGE